MPNPDPDAQFDEFADLDAKLDDFFGETAETNEDFKQMTQQFFKGSGDMKAWDQVDQVSHQAVDDDHQEEVDQEWDDFAESFFSDDDEDSAASTDTGADAGFVANQTVRFDFGGGAPSPSIGPAIGAEEEQETYNLFLKKIANPKQRAEAVKIIMDVASVDEKEAEAISKKPFIKVLIGVPKAQAEDAKQKFKAAGFVATIKKCL